MSRRGKYIVIEGQDGTGKTTQANLLQEHLEKQGIDVIHIKEPGGSPIAEEVRRVILNSSLSRTPMTNTLLFTAIRHELWNSVIQPALDVGTWVICTRNYWSTIAYQGHGEGADIPIISAITQTFTASEYMRPDKAIMLSFFDNEARRKRISQRGSLYNPDTFESRDDDFQNRINNAYVEIARDYNIPLIDASQSIDKIQAQIRTTILTSEN